MTSESTPSTEQLTAPSAKMFALVYVGAIIVRAVLAVLFGNHEPHIVDAQDYDRLAIGILEHGIYLTPTGQPSSLRPPLYPALVALVYLLFGAKNWLAVSVIQSAISLLTMRLTQSVGNHLAGPKVGLAAAAIVGFYPSLLVFNCLVLSETLFTFFFVAAVWASLRLQADANWRFAVALGLCLGLGALTRSILWTCAPPLLLCLLVTMQGRFLQRCSLLCMTGVVFVVVLAPWAYRNTKIHRTFTLVDVMGGRNVMMGNYEFTPQERSWATITDVTGDQAWHRVLAKANPDYPELTQGQIDKRAMKYGIAYFFAHPALTAKRCVVRFFNFWQLERTISAGLRAGIWGDVSKVTFLVASAVLSGSYALLVLASIYGIVINRFSWRQNVLLLLWIALPCAIHTIAFAHSRYHLPLIPILSVYASSFLLPSSRPERQSRLPYVIATLLCVVLIAGWVRELVFVDFGMLG